jgi:hypothetical protein
MSRHEPLLLAACTIVAGLATIVAFVGEVLWLVFIGSMITTQFALLLVLAIRRWRS